MAKLEFLIVLAALFACQISQSNAGISSKNWPYPSKEWSLINDPSNHERRAYLACKGRQGPFPRIQYCKIGYHKLTHSTEDNTCNVILQVGQNAEITYIGENPIVFLFGKDKSVLFWREFGPKTFLRIYIISSSSCHISSTRMIAPVSEDFRNDFKFTAGNQSFDIFYKNDTCGDKICWVTIDDKAKRIGPIAYIQTKDQYLPSFVKRIEDDAPEKGHFMVVPTKEGGVDFFLTKPDETSKLLAHSSKDWGITLSLANNLVGLCYQAETGSKCAQYDFNGKTKLEVNMDGPRSIYNLANGGFLSISEHEGKCNRYDCSKFFLVTKTDSNGANIGNFKCSGEWYIRKMYENEEGKYCLSEPCERKTPAGSSSIDCFDDTIFSK